MDRVPGRPEALSEPPAAPVSILGSSSRGVDSLVDRQVFACIRSRMADVYKALADQTRRLILDELAARDGQTLFEICSLLIARHGVSSSRQAISQHLAVLESAGLVTVRWRGRSKVHYFDGEPLTDITARWLNPGKDTS